MILLNSQITLLEETHLTYQFVKAFLNRIRWAMLNLWDIFLHQKIPPKYLSNFDVRISYVLIRLIIPVFFLYQECQTWMKKNWTWMAITEKYDWPWIRLNCRKLPILFVKFLFQKSLGFNFLADRIMICLKFVKMLKK